jgi:hypothetical protein
MLALRLLALRWRFSAPVVACIACIDGTEESARCGAAALPTI